jgi:hypothetical protein
VAKAEKVSFTIPGSSDECWSLIASLSSGGKVKPLKSAKKEKKDLDEDDLAFKEKQRAGMCSQRCIHILSVANPLFLIYRGQSQEGTSGQGKGQGSAEHRSAGHQEVRKEMIPLLL